MPLLSAYARNKKISYFLADIGADERILEVGSGTGWVGEWCAAQGYKHYVGLDMRPPADIVGDIKQWRDLGLQPASFDVIIAFEVVEHVDCFRECYDLLRDGGLMLITTPVPHWDWLLRLLEMVGLNQPRHGAHDRLVYLREVTVFERKEIRIVGGLSQWGVFHKCPGDSQESAGASNE